MRVLSGEVLVPHLHGGVLGHLVQLVLGVIAVPRRLFDKSIVAEIDGIGKQFVHCFDNH